MLQCRHQERAKLAIFLAKLGPGWRVEALHQSFSTYPTLSTARIVSCIDLVQVGRDRAANEGLAELPSLKLVVCTDHWRGQIPQNLIRGIKS